MIDSSGTRTGIAAVNGPTRSYPGHETTLDLIDHQVNLAPDAVAVTYGEDALTFQELDTKANRLASILCDAGAEPGRLLPLFIADGLELPLAIVASMKAAVPFVPFDPSWPAGRTQAMLRTLGADLIMTSPGTPDQELGRCRGISVDVNVLGCQEVGPIVPRPKRSDVFYGFFTSGTTGAPKCTLNHHLGLLNRFLAMTDAFGGGHTALQNSRSVFDSSLWQILWPLTSGGRVVMPVRDDLLDLEQTIRQIGRHRVTMTDFVPSIFSLVADLIAQDPDLADSARTLRRILLGGEAINVNAVRRFHGVLPHVLFTNTYGPTEASIGSVFHHFGPPPPVGVEVPIGLPIDNTSVVIVDDQLRPVPPETTGELLIGGDCVGLGYLADSDRTARSFIANPFSDVLGERLYRTGDLGQFRDDGLLYFIGRRDDQMKFRGVRIEPTEIENALTDVPGILDAKVLIDGNLDQAQLVAALVSDGPLPHDLAGRIGATLPAELRPDRFVRLDKFPLSANGKTDRLALAAQLRAAGSAHTPHHLEGDQARVGRLWAEVLSVVVDDADLSFFDLGGSSLSAQRLALAMTTEFGRRISVRDVFNYPTVRLQAGLASSGGGSVIDAEGQIFEDARIDSWREERSPSPGRPQHILLTGATGFVGVHVIEALLRRTTAAISCLVRPEKGVSARSHLRSRLSYYGLGHLLDDPRVIIETGDLEAPRMGLGDSQHSFLIDSVDTVVHAGAQVNLVAPYAQLRRANVVSTMSLIEFARNARRKSIHYLSTLSVLPDGDCFDERSRLAENTLPLDGYSQTKWVSESLLDGVRRQGLSVSVYRLGEVMPHASTGVMSHSRSLTEILLEGCLALGVVIRSGAVSDFSPVDVVAEFIAANVLDAGVTQAPGSCYHAVGARGLPLDDLLLRLRSLNGLDIVSYSGLRRLVASRIDAGGAPEAVQKLSMLLPSDDVPESRPLAGLFFDPTSAGFRQNFASRCLELDFRWPAVTPEVIRVWCDGASRRTPA